MAEYSEKKGAVIRDACTDYLKAAAILGVVFIHVSWPYSETFRFCVPVFVCLWALFFEKGLAKCEKDQIWPYAFNKFLGLLIPYAFWTALYLGIFYSVEELRSFPLHTVIGGLLGGYGWAGQYFFIILFQLIWLIPFLRMVVRPELFWIFVVSCILFNISAEYFWFNLPYVGLVSDRFFGYWVLYSILGIAFARGFPIRRPSLLFCSVAFLLVASTEAGILEKVMQYHSRYLSISVTLGSVFLLLALAPRYGQSGWRPNRLIPEWLDQSIAVVFPRKLDSLLS